MTKTKHRHHQDKAALYMRVSTHEQTVEPQRLELRQYVERHGLKLVGEFEDKVWGASWSREGLDRLLKSVTKGEVNVVLCVKMDRLGRSLPHLAQLIDKFDRHGCAFVATSQGIDTRMDSPAGRLQMAVLIGVAEFERAMISERTKAGLVAARARGKVIGRPRTELPMGWRETVAEWRAEKATGGAGLRELARRLGLSLTGTHALVHEKEPAAVDAVAGV